MSKQYGPQGYAIVSRYLVSATATDGYYTSLSAAIAQAVTDGASSSNPKTIYLKDGVYSTNITLSDGINIDCSGGAILQGSVSLASGTAYINNVTISPASGVAAFNISGGTLTASYCNINLTAAVGVVYTTMTSKTFYLLDSTMIGDSTSTFYSHDGSNATILHSIQYSTVNFPTGITTLSGAAGTVNSRYIEANVQHAMLIELPTFSHVSLRSVCSQASTGSFFSVQSGTNGGQISSWYTRFANNAGSTSAFIAIGVSAFAYEEYDCIFPATGGTFNPVTFASGQTVQSRSLNYYGGEMFSGTRTGFSGSENLIEQGFLQTTSASAATIYTVSVPAGTAVTVVANVIGSNAAHSDVTGGKIVVTADGTIGAIIGSPIVNLNATSTGSFTASFSSNQLLIQVIAPSTSAYNWVALVSVQPLLSNS
jgi:hypothetical protein